MLVVPVGWMSALVSANSGIFGLLGQGVTAAMRCTHVQGHALSRWKQCVPTGRSSLTLSQNPVTAKNAVALSGALGTLGANAPPLAEREET